MLRIRFIQHTMSSTLVVKTAVHGLQDSSWLTGQFESETLAKNLLLSTKVVTRMIGMRWLFTATTRILELLSGDLPWEISKTCHYFTTHEGKIIGEVTACCIHNEEAGGMEIPQCQIFERNTVP